MPNIQRNRPGQANASVSVPPEAAVSGRGARLWAWLRQAALDRSNQTAVAGGLAGALAFEPFNLFWLIPLTPLACFLVIKMAPTPAAALRRGWLLGWVYSFGTLHWLCTLWMFNYFAPLGIVLLGGYLGFYIGLVAYITRRWFWGGGDFSRFGAFASLWLLLEWFRTLGRLAVPLVQLGHAWASLPWAIQVAQWLGELGVSLQVLAVAGLAVWWGKQIIVRPAGPLIRWVYPALVTLVVVGWFLLSAQIARQWDAACVSPAGPHQPLRVAMVQPAVNQMAKLQSYAYPDPEVRDRLSREISELTEQILAPYGANRWDMAVLPETAYTQPDFFHNEAIKTRISALARRMHAALFFGSDHSVSDTEAYNSAYFVHADGRFDPNIYDKMRLVPFGECLPYFDLIPGFQEFVVGILSFSEGKSQTVYEIEGLRFGALICFESTFSSMARGLARLGANFMIVVTNDAWYGMSAGAAHHHHLSLLRAVETRRWIVRCANTGISSFIAPSGRATDSLPLGTQGLIEKSLAIPLSPPLTAFARWGNAWLALAPFALLVLLFASRGKSRRR